MRTAARQGSTRWIPLLALALACAGAQPPTRVDAPSERSSPVLARVDGRAITRDELDDHLRDQLFEREVASQSEAEQYQIRLRALDGYIDRVLIEERARERGVSPNEFLELHLTSFGHVTDVEVARFFEENRARFPPDATLASARPRIREHLRSVREARAIAALRDGARISIEMEPARVRVLPLGPSRGPDDARVTIVEFSDFQCPYCRRAAPVIEEVLRRYASDVRLVYRHLPLDGIHSRARPAAEASVCADEQGVFWAYHDLLFEHQRALGDQDLLRYAQEAGMSLEAFRTCRERPDVKARVERDVADARALRLDSTPSFLVNGVLLSGAQPVDDFVRLIELELR